MWDLNLNGIFYLAIFGLVCGVLALLGGGAWLVWFVINHVHFV